ncbi:MAG: ABC transporter permease [Gemmatimonadetes bacterium]|nr:ABC transporter permease [Gemmatimonadota bacterium]
MPAELIAGPMPRHRVPTFRPFDLTWTLIRTDFKTRYHGTVAGFLWALLKPLALVLVLMGVFSFIFGDRESYAINLVIGLLLYNFFTDATKTGLMSLFIKSFLLNKTVAPPWILVVTSISNAVITLLVVWGVLLTILTLSGHVPSLAALGLVTIYFVHYLAMVIGISLALSVLFLVYRDLNEIWDVVSQAGFFLAPIIYPLDILPEHLHFWLFLWPPTPIIQFTRDALVTGVPPTLTAHVLLTAESAIILLIGILIFRHYRPRIAEYV